MRPMAALVQAACDARDDVVSATVVYPVSEPTEIAGYMVFSARHSALVYLLTKPAYARRGVARYLLELMPTLSADRNPRDPRRYFLHTHSTVEFAKMGQHLGLKVRYSPHLLYRLLDEITEEAHAA